jgi:hypothetical protein
MQKRNRYLNATMRIASPSTRLGALFVGVDLEAGEVRCTSCYSRVDAGWGYIPWRPTDSSSTGFLGANYVMCESCEKRFDRSEPVRKRFYRKLENEAPRLTAQQIAQLPTLWEEDANATRH